jgi:MFS transporter, DHA1 family, inner membrane transport protein
MGGLLRDPIRSKVPGISMAFFRNSTVNLLNLHYGIHSIALSGGAAFLAAYLLKFGISVTGVLVALALILFGRFVIRPIVIGLAARSGLRAMVVAGTLLSALQYPFLAEVRGVGFPLAALIAVSAVGDTVYWTTYHAYFAALGDDEFRGRQIGVREAIAALVGIASPLAAGWMLVAFGPRVAFGTTAVIAALAALPILWAPNVAVARRVPGALRAALPGMLLFVADGWIAAGYWLVWQIALFVSLGESFLAYGGALASAALVGAIGGLTLGRHIDAGHGKLAVYWACGTLALIIVLRAVATGNATLAVLANALGALGACLYIPTLMTPVYTLAKRSPCTLRFHVGTEGGWDVGGAGGLLAAALATGFGMPLSISIIFSLAGVAAIIAMLRRYYAGRSAELVSAI